MYNALGSLRGCRFLFLLYGDVDYLQPGGSYYSSGLSGTWWEADLDRKGEIQAIFGEAYIDIGDKTQLTVGFRNYDQDGKSKK